MITVLLIIALAVLIVGLVGGFLNDWDGIFILLTIVGLILVVIFGWIVIASLEKIATVDTINQKIEMYEEENAKIEAEIDALVKQYMEFEKETYGSLKAESTMTLVSLFPELKSDELVMRQMDVYKTNSQKLKDLREEKINISKSKWRVYFGH